MNTVVTVRQYRLLSTLVSHGKNVTNELKRQVETDPSKSVKAIIYNQSRWQLRHRPRPNWESIYCLLLLSSLLHVAWEQLTFYGML